ncbi:MAG: hypothetical protein V4591_04735 [Bdellovibrionota bacterium]
MLRSNTPPEDAEGLQKNLKKHYLDREKSKNNKFVLCMRNEGLSARDGESLLMWDMYTQKSNSAVKISFDKEKITQYLKSVFDKISCSLIDKNVQYDNSDLQPDTGDLLFRKDVNFSFEQEYRFVAELSESPEDPFYPVNSIPARPFNPKSYMWLKEEEHSLITRIHDQMPNQVGDSNFITDHGFYIPLDYFKHTNLIAHIQFSPYCSELNKQNIRYLAKTYLFPQLISTTIRGCNSQYPETIENHNRIRNSSFDGTVNKIW